jgi:DNA repair protein RecN (Recombination protein N)
VEKGTADGVTSADVRVVTGDQRASEVARMLGGDPSSTVGLAHATELLTGKPQTVAAHESRGSKRR